MKNYRPFGRPGGKPPHKGPPPPAFCCDDGYIVERIVNRQVEPLCYEGFLCLEGLPGGLCPPLSLCDVQVAQIRPCEGGLAVCACGAQKIELTLLCAVTDARGCRAEGCATIQMESCAQPRMNCPGLNLRRGAEICVSCARFCPPYGFDVSLSISLQTLFSRCEMCASRPACPSPFVQPLPLYPPPIRRFR